MKTSKTGGYILVSVLLLTTLVLGMVLAALSFVDRDEQRLHRLHQGHLVRNLLLDGFRMAQSGVSVGKMSGGVRVDEMGAELSYRVEDLTKAYQSEARLLAINGGMHARSLTLIDGRDELEELDGRERVKSYYALIDSVEGRAVVPRSRGESAYPVGPLVQNIECRHVPDVAKLVMRHELKLTLWNPYAVALRDHTYRFKIEPSERMPLEFVYSNGVGRYCADLEVFQAQWHGSFSAGSFQTIELVYEQALQKRDVDRLNGDVVGIRFARGRGGGSRRGLSLFVLDMDGFAKIKGVAGGKHVSRTLAFQDWRQTNPFAQESSARNRRLWRVENLSDQRRVYAKRVIQEIPQERNLGALVYYIPDGGAEEPLWPMRADVRNLLDRFYCRGDHVFEYLGRAYVRDGVSVNARDARLWKSVLGEDVQVLRTDDGESRDYVSVGEFVGNRGLEALLGRDLGREKYADVLDRLVVSGSTYRVKARVVGQRCLEGECVLQDDGERLRRVSARVGPRRRS